jgi:divalent metal cation (Fe/Co/Zn/Cd) transporter
VTRAELVERARLLSIASIALSGALGALAVVVGLASSRLSLLGFGFDAAIDSVASVVLVWRFQLESRHPARAERAEHIAELAIGAVLVVLAIYLAVNAVRTLASGGRPESTGVGLLISIASFVALPALAVAKYRVARSLESRALRADSILTGVAALLAFFAVVGYVLTEVFTLEWADSVAALVVAAVLGREGALAFRPRGLAAEG